ncbi:MAG: ATP-dependent DNA helicase RecG [Chloroflexota bacterium]
MPSALETLVKILKLEQDQGYQDTAVIGGLKAFSRNWTPDAHRQARIEMHHILVDDLSQLMEQYDTIDGKTDRHEAVSYMLDRIMMRIKEPREDYRPRNNWGGTEAVEEKPAPPKKQERRKRQEKPPRKEKKPRESKQKDNRSRQNRGRKPSSSSHDDFSYQDDEFDMAYDGSGESDMPPEPRLERPPRKPRKAIDPQEAADIMHGLRANVTEIKGVGAKLAETLANINIRTVEDMLFYLPRRYDDYTRLLPLNRLEPEMVTTVIGTVRQSHTRMGRGRKDFAFTLDDGTGTLAVTFFGGQWLRNKIRDGHQLVLSGKVTIWRNTLQMTNPEWEPLESDNLRARGIVPVYGLTKGLNARRFRGLTENAVNFWAERLPDYVPEAVLERTELADIGWTMKNLHFPEGWDHLGHAQRRYIFDELLLMQLAIMQNRREWQSEQAQPIPVDEEWLETFLSVVFPYEMTTAQRRSVNDIARDIVTDVPMNRLIQGDVGSGKTAVAITGLALAYNAGVQSALMAPTSILAEQHYESVTETLAQMPGDKKPTVALLIGALSKVEREEVYAGLENGSIDIVVGTHALIQEGFEFNNLGLAIIDEQHRFGVEQRGALRGKGHNPHLLVMTATPIPRTLALTMYADLDLSVIDEMPPGRTPVKTTVRPPAMREHCFDFIKAQLDAGRQAFIVHPLVEASESEMLADVRNAVDAYEELQTVFYEYRVGLLHGKMKPDEKDENMRAFAAHEFDVLVTTSVAEVGVNVPNASVIMIEGANRFGLSQLHQFRGRVGRGKHPGYCLLIPDKLTEEAELRLDAMVQTTDGFVLAEMDWELRGAGDLLAVRQSGGNKLQLQEKMNPELVDLASQEARTIYAEDPDLSLDEHRLLRQRVEQLIDARSDVS